MSVFRIAPHVLLTVMLLCVSSSGQKVQVSGLAAIPNLGQLTRRSGYIFGGTVTSVSRAAAGTSGGFATVRISFRVEQAVLGVRSGHTLTISEWAGLWDAGERYHPGKRVMLFLYPTSRLGLTSSVGGGQGRFRIDGAGRIVLPPASLLTASSGAGNLRRDARDALIYPRKSLEAVRQAGRK